MSLSFTDYLQQQDAPEGLKSVLSAMAEACVQISGRVRLGALADIFGSAGLENVQGEEQQKLDDIANTLCIEALTACPNVAGLASEEEEHFVAANAGGQYLVLFDPLDGSSNINVDISVGTIFSVLGKPEGPLDTASFLQPGCDQLAAGYILYGPQTILVVTLKNGVAFFTLDADNRFIQTQNTCTIPAETGEFAINMSNMRHWEAPVRGYIEELLAGETGPRAKNYNMRWVASMVAEVHRILMRGGIFLYPKDGRDPKKPGKLRLMYEANPMSLLVEQAGGSATDARMPVTAIRPEALHQRVAVILGSRSEVQYVTDRHRTER